MGISTAQAVFRTEKTTAGAARPDAGTTMGEQVMSLVSLPSRKDLEKAVCPPAILSADELKTVQNRKGVLEKSLKEIDFRLSNDADKSMEQVKKKLGEWQVSRLSFNDRLGIGAVFGIIGGFIGSIPAAIFFRHNPSGGLHLAVGSAISVAVLINAAEIIATMIRRFQYVEEHIFQNEAAPSSGIVKGALKGIMNPLIRLRALLYGGPSCKAAKEFDSKMEEIDNLEEPAELKTGRRQIAVNSLQFAKEKTQSELSLLKSKLAADQKARQAEKGTKESSVMLEELIEGLAITDSTDQNFLHETAMKTEALLNILQEFRQNRSCAIPEDLSAMKCFSNIIEWLTRNHVDERTKDTFFDRFKSALDLRLHKVCSGAGLPKPHELVP